MQARLLRFLPARVRPASRDELRRAQLTIAGCWLAAAIAGSIALAQAFAGVGIAALVSAACGAVGAALPFYVRRTGHWRRAAGALVAVTWVSAFTVAALTAAMLVPALYYLAIAAAIATITLGLRVGLALGVVNMGVVSAFYVLHVTGTPPVIPVPAETALRSAIRGGLSFNLALFALLAAYEWLRSASVRDSEETERRFRALADYGPDLIVEMDATGRILETNPALAGRRDLMAGRLAQEGIHPDDQPALREAARALRTQASVRVGPLRWKRRSSEETRWIEASLTRFEAGGEARLLAVSRDVTARVTLEAQLRQSQKMQAVGQLASGLAHDFNNLLTVVSGYAEVLAARVRGDAQALAAAEEIQRASEQGAAMTRRLLALSRPSTISRSAIDLNQVVRDEERMLRVLLGESITLLLEVAPGEARVLADAGEIEQILVNLVANTRDALPSGGTVRIATHARGGRASLVVHDNGAGIEPSLRERIFEPFVTTKKTGSGTGLGLYVVYTIVSGLGGEIDVQTEPLAGTRFTVNLPLLAPMGRAASGAPRGEPAGGRERVLIVEDQSELRALLRESLSSVGYQVIVAADGVEAVALGVRDEIDLVLSDIVMPRMGGLELVAVLREKRPELRALFVSGDPPELSQLDPRDRLLRKPFLIHDLRRAVREALDAGEARAQPGANAAKPA